MSLPKPSFGWRKIIRVPSKSSSGPVFLRRRGQDRRRVFYELPYGPGVLTDTTYAEVLAQWDAADGGANSFSWTPPGGASAITVRFAQDSLDFDIESVVASGTTLLLEQEVPTT